MDDAAHNADIVRRIALRDPGARAAEAELCRRFAPRARLYGRRHLRSDERAGDLAQAVMLAVIEAARAGRIEDGLRLDRFVLGTCRNIASRMREVDARAEPTDSADLDLLAAAHARTPTMEALDVGALFKCFRGLAPRDRTVIHLSFNEEQSAEEIAVIVDTTPGNVRVLRHRAVAQLRRCLEDCGEAGR
jgi:RNA polymerase sigma-70 factor (ECF subfamily)